MIFRSLPTLEEQRAVGAAEAEGIRQGILDFGLLGVVGDEVQGVALRVGIIQVDGRRKALVAQCEHGDAGLQAAGAAQEMSRHRFS